MIHLTNKDILMQGWHEVVMCTGIFQFDDIGPQLELRSIPLNIGCQMVSVVLLL
jgi:hypothetical protein